MIPDEKLDAMVAADERRLRDAYRRIGSATETGGAAQLSEPSSDPFDAAIQFIGRIEDFAVQPGRAISGNPDFEARLEQAALASKFRYRLVVLQEPWWREEGPPLLVRIRDTDEARVAVCSGGRYRLHDPVSGDVRSVTADIARTISPDGYMLYAALPNRLTPGVLSRFALHGAGGEIRSLLLSGGIAVMLGFIIPVVTGAVVASAIPEGRPAMIWELALLVAAAGLGVAGFTFGRSFAMIRASSLINLRLQSAIWDRILRLPTAFFRNYSTGDLAQRVLAVDRARRVLTGPVLNGLLSGLFAMAGFILMLLYDLRLALYGLGFALLTGITLLLIARRQLVHTGIATDLKGRVVGRVIDILGGVGKLRVAAAEERAFEQWSIRFAAERRATWQAARLRALQAVTVTVLPALGTLGMFAVAGLRDEPIDLASFSAFSAAFAQFVAAAAMFGLSLSMSLDAVPYIRRFMPILDAVPEVDDGGTDPGRLSGEIRLSGVSFRYTDSGAPVLDGIDIEVRPGEFVAIVGPSGSGKSTLLRLLLGFERPGSGAVFYDGQDLARLDVRLVRRQIGTVLQSAGLTPGSIHDNIAGARRLGEEEVMAAAELAGLADDIRAFPMGLETIVAEGGGTLSGGQRQRVMIARALIGKPACLLFDEATSALDNRTQSIVSGSLAALKVTRIVIAHRLSTIRNADRILVIERGRLVEEGTYADLMERRGAFFRMAERQLA